MVYSLTKKIKIRPGLGSETFVEPKTQKQSEAKAPLSLDDLLGGLGDLDPESEVRKRLQPAYKRKLENLEALKTRAQNLITENDKKPADNVDIIPLHDEISRILNDLYKEGKISLRKIAEAEEKKRSISSKLVGAIGYEEYKGILANDIIPLIAEVQKEITDRLIIPDSPGDNEEKTTESPVTLEGSDKSQERLKNEALLLIGELEGTLKMNSLNAPKSPFGANSSLSIMGKIGKLIVNMKGYFSEEENANLESQLLNLKNRFEKIVVKGEESDLGSIDKVLAENKGELKNVLQEMLRVVDGPILKGILTDEEYIKYKNDKVLRDLIKVDPEFTNLVNEFNTIRLLKDLKDMIIGSPDLEVEGLEILRESSYNRFFNLIGYEGYHDSTDSQEFKNCISSLPEETQSSAIEVKELLVNMDMQIEAAQDERLLDEMFDSAPSSNLEAGEGGVVKKGLQNAI